MLNKKNISCFLIWEIEILEFGNLFYFSYFFLMYGGEMFKIIESCLDGFSSHVSICSASHDKCTFLGKTKTDQI